MRGHGAVKLRNRSHTLRPGSIFSYGPGVRQDIIADPADPLAKCFVGFVGKKSKEILRLCHLPMGTAAQVYPAN